KSFEKKNRIDSEENYDALVDDALAGRTLCRRLPGNQKSAQVKCKKCDVGLCIASDNPEK
ncbi:hypothetical protein L9F63_022693, partial [Diploptera punctata]